MIVQNYDGIVQGQVLNFELQPCGNKKTVQFTIQGLTPLMPLKMFFCRKSTVFYGDNNSVGIFNQESVRLLADSYINSTFPHVAQALDTLKTNALKFLALLDKELKHQSPGVINKFSEARIQIALKNALEGSSVTDETDIRKTLSSLLLEGVNQSNSTLVELTVNEAIITSSKLNLNLIKMLGLSFIFSRTKLDHFMDGLFDKIDRGIKRMLEKYSEIAGLRRTVLPYQSRHFLFTWLKTKGIDDALIQPYSDHENRASLEIYSKLSLSDAQESYDDNIKDFPV